ncbi:YciI family protein [Formosa sp. PL04]|uniref:YciI family protein n=1 Tax=Formosa sp. PL04 TaxID=3081755 RepID=UPI002981E6FA|nr:YciI family protein [Formosa sp. PL04]MDW5289072.1 YciI family protein [Formosa sp. PL04]
MKYSIVIIAILTLFSCKKNESTTTVQQTVTDSISLSEVVIDTVITEIEVVAPPKSYKEIKAELTAKGFETYDLIDEVTKDTILMKQYFVAFLKGGAVRTQNEEEAKDLQDEHIAYLKNMYELGYADVSGPFGDEGEIRGITIYNVPTKKMADSLANSDPMVKAGRLEIEIHPWWAASGFKMR